MSKKFSAVVSALLAFVWSFGSTPAFADPWPNLGEFTFGGALWQFDNFGIAQGTDTSRHFDGNHSIYYPLEFFINNNNDLFQSGHDFVYCPNESTSQVSTQSDGDIVIECPRYELGTNTSVFAQLRFRIYGVEDNGWLLREELILSNDSGSDFTFNDLYTYQYAENYVYDSTGSNTFITSSGGNSALATNDTWFISAMNNGGSIVQTISWARTGNAAQHNITAGGYANIDGDLRTQYGQRIVPAGDSLHFIQFVNMNIPASPFTSSADAVADAQSQVQEFSVFTGRLTRGLDPLIDYIGWGLPVSTPTPTSTPTTVATSTPVTTVSLANTGSGVEVSNLLTISVVISTVGALMVLRSRKRNRFNY
ncbi:hypothetical protein [Aurantimicrobium minutum]|uniref:hypothetical protein n=1 Tax=Aurantimicrobium minutum TaxID=708131 RepID=UPI0024747214|nr:hypothetical protein [Aurantimicrobium minutum]MDH6254727.1 hypothetical protein [Aurantimicrobium minutum]